MLKQSPLSWGARALVPFVVILAVGLVGRDEQQSHAATSASNARIASTASAPPPHRHNPRIDPSVDSLPGFDVELLYRPKLDSEGSWVALCKGPGSSLFAADQYGKIYELTPPALDDFESPLGVRPLGVEIEGAQGLCYAFDSLYVMATGRGLMRVRDADGDGTFEDATLLVAVRGEGEHGPHGVVVAPDGASLLFACGNHTPLPQISSSREPQVWQEDQLLPRDNDPRGHAVGVMAPGGYICQVQPDGSDVRLWCAGFRNTYDLAVGPAGDIFTYDSDMEWDLGLPWYRPARICHAVSGVDFGWRNGSGKWPSSMEDSCPPMCEIGPGSPTGLTFGIGANFPSRYQRALFCLDWTYGIIYAAHLKPSGGSWSADVEVFLSGKPLPVTDVAIGADGAMYFTTGGRRTQSGLYRVVYRGEENTGPAHFNTTLTYEQAMRRSLEALHRNDPPAGALSTIWNQLGHEDRFIRQAARIALEHQPVERWRDRALSETDANRAVIALIALIRHAQPTDRAAIIEALSKIDPDRVDRPRRLAWLRAWELACIRLKPLDQSQRRMVLASIDPRFPSGDLDFDRTAARILVALDAPEIIDRCLARMDELSSGAPPAWADLARRNEQYGSAIKAMLDRPPPTEQLSFARALSFVDHGWTLNQRQRYLTLLNRATLAGGGLSVGGYINDMRQRHLASCTDEERTMLAALAEPPQPDDAIPLVQPTGPGRAWTVAEAESEMDRLRGRPDLMRGAGLFRAIACASCHQIAGHGANAGPDLSSAGNKYSQHDLLRAIINPSDAITDQYVLNLVTLKDGKVVRGLILASDADHIELAQDFMHANQTVSIDRSDIASIEPSKQSPMPPGLINAMNPAELRDLVAYVLSGGQTGDQ